MGEEKFIYYVVYSATNEVAGGCVKGSIYSHGPLETKDDIERVIREILVLSGDLSHVVLDNWKRIN